MSPQVRAVVGFKRFTDPQLITTGREVVKEMKDNRNFPNPPEELKTLDSAVEELSAALAAPVQGGTAATAHKKNKRDAVIDLLVKLAHYVQDNCGQIPRLSCPAVFSSQPTIVRSRLWERSCRRKFFLKGFFRILVDRIRRQRAVVATGVLCP
jgi:hypothetical protein